MTQRFALDDFRDDIGDALVAARIVDCENVRMIERRYDMRLALEALAPLNVVRQREREDLAGDLTAEPRIAGSVDLADSSGPECRQYVVRSVPWSTIQ